MKSYTTLRNLYGKDTKNDVAANLTYGDQIMNDYHRRLLSKADWPFLLRLRTATTVASTTFVDLPYDADQVESVFVTVSSTRYTPNPAPSREFWDKLHYSTYTSDTPEWWFVYNGQLGLWPQPSSSGNTITLNAKIRVQDLNIADYVTGTIDIITNGDETVTGDSTVWTTPMVGRWLRVTHSDTATASGDGIWYEISSRASNTELELVRPYGGTSLITAAAGAYVIGMMPLLPEAFHDLPEMYGAYRYWTKEKDTNRATFFRNELSVGESDLFTAYGFQDLSMVIDEGIDDRSIINPNLIVTL
jgi:hypothetical protein